MTVTPIVESEGEFDFYQLTREIDRTKSDLFSDKEAAFYGPLQCSMNFVWTMSISTACTDGIVLAWNPRWFLKLKRPTRLTVLMHELMHPANLHMVRQGDRDPREWNIACDIKINNRLHRLGFSFEGVEDCCMDLTFPEDAVEEDIYLQRQQQGFPPPLGFPGFKDKLTGSSDGSQGGNQGNQGDMDTEGLLGPLTKEQQAQAVNNVIRAVEQAKLSAGLFPGEVEGLLSKFLSPIVPWEQHLHRFFTDLVDGGYSWRKPNRRYTHLYLPSQFQEEGALSHLAYFEDVSGSITDDNLIRFNSEIKFCKEQFEPPKITLVQFDTIIQFSKEYTPEDDFQHIPFHGRGGTCLRCVREWIIEHQPTAAVIFTDMICAPMERLPLDIPILWVVVSNREATAPQGTLIHIT